MTHRSIFGLLAALIATTPASAQTMLERATANYVALQNGSKRLADLSASEIAEVSELDRTLANRKSMTSRDCDRQRDAAKTELDRTVLSLKCPPPIDP